LFLISGLLAEERQGGIEVLHSILTSILPFKGTKPNTEKKLTTDEHGWTQIGIPFPRKKVRMRGGFLFGIKDPLTSDPLPSERRFTLFVMHSPARSWVCVTQILYASF
jgi:hypothetical protein